MEVKRRGDIQQLYQVPGYAGSSVSSKTKNCTQEIQADRSLLVKWLTGETLLRGGGWLHWWWLVDTTYIIDIREYDNLYTKLYDFNILHTYKVYHVENIKFHIEKINHLT